MERTTTETPRDDTVAIPDPIAQLVPLLEALDEGVLITTWEPDPRVVHANPASLLLLAQPRERLLGRNPLGLPWTVADHEAAALRDRLSFGQVMAMAAQVPREGAAPMPVLLTVFPVASESGGLCMWLIRPAGGRVRIQAETGVAQALAAAEAVAEAQDTLAEAMQEAEEVLTDLQSLTEKVESGREAVLEAEEAQQAIDVVSKVALEASEAVLKAQTAEQVVSTASTAMTNVGKDALRARDSARSAAETAAEAAEAVAGICAAGEVMIDSLEPADRSGRATPASAAGATATEVTVAAAERVVEETVEAAAAVTATQISAQQTVHIVDEVAAEAARAADAGRLAGNLVAEAAEAVEAVAGDAALAVRAVQTAGEIAAEALRIASASAEKAVEAQEQVRAESKAKTEYVRHLNHELRTPVGAVASIVEFLLEDGYGPLNPGQRQAMLDIQVASEHLLALVNNVLDISKIEAGMMELAIEDVGLSEVYQQCLRTVRPLADKGRITLRLDCPPDLGLRADPVRLRQMLLNLLSNAVKFTPAGGKVTMSADVMSDGTVRLAVKDTGVGLTAEQAERAVKPFVQVHKSQQAGQPGTGLGLSIVQKLAELHGGRLQIDSKPGKGTTMSLLFPGRAV